MDEIQLRKIGDPEPEKNTLPRGVYAVTMGDSIIFVRRMAGRFIPLSQSEQEELRSKHLV